MWMFRLTHAFVPALLILLLTVLLDVAPRQIAFSGFASEGFFLCFGIFIMGAQIFSSGLLTRFTFLILRFLPKTRFSRNLVLFLNGGLLSMVLPAPAGRATLLTPLTYKMLELEELIPDAQDNIFSREKYDLNNLDLTPLLVSLTHGATLLSVVFLIGNPLNLILLDLAGAQTKLSYGQWVNWFVPAEVALLILILGWLIVMLWLTIDSSLPPVNKDEISAELVEMGSLKRNELGAIAALIVFAISAMTINIHHIPLAWISFGIGLGLYLYDIATPEDLQSEKFEWSTLLFIAALSSWQPIMEYLKLDDALVAAIEKLLNNLSASFNLADFVSTRFGQLPLVVLALTIAIVLIRFILPGGPTFVLLMTVLSPVTTKAGIDPWVLGFTLLLLCEEFLLPYQHPAYSQAMAELKKRNLLTSYKPRKLFIANLFLLLTRAAAVVASFWYWRYIHVF